MAKINDETAKYGRYLWQVLAAADVLPRSVQTCVTKKPRSTSHLTCRFPTSWPVLTHRLPRLVMCLNHHRLTTLCTLCSRQWPHTHWTIGTTVLTRGYCHDLVYDALLLALMPTQALAGLTLIFTQHDAQPPVTHHLTYAIILLISLSITHRQHHRESFGTYLPFLVATCIQHIHLYSDTLTYRLVIGW